MNCRHARVRAILVRMPLHWSLPAQRDADGTTLSAQNPSSPAIDTYGHSSQSDSIIASSMICFEPITGIRRCPTGRWFYSDCPVDVYYQRLRVPAYRSRAARMQPAISPSWRELGELIYGFAAVAQGSFRNIGTLDIFDTWWWRR